MNKLERRNLERALLALLWLYYFEELDPAEQLAVSESRAAIHRVLEADEGGDS